MVFFNLLNDSIGLQQKCYFNSLLFQSMFNTSSAFFAFYQMKFAWLRLDEVQRKLAILLADVHSILCKHRFKREAHKLKQISVQCTFKSSGIRINFLRAFGQSRRYASKKNNLKVFTSDKNIENRNISITNLAQNNFD